MITDDIMRFMTWAYDYDAPFAVPSGSYRIRADRLPGRLNSVEMFDTTAAGAVTFTHVISRAQTPLPGYFIGGFDPDETFGRYFNGDIAELIIYQGALDDADLQAVTDYLREKYFPGARPGGPALP